MPMSFNNIPNNLRTPLFYSEMNNSAASKFSTNSRALLIGQTLNTVGVDIPQLLSSEGVTTKLVGQGSILSEMYKAFRKNESMVELWGLPLQDSSMAVAATGKITISGTAVANGVLSLYVAGKLVSVGVAKDETSTIVAENIAKAINSSADLSVKATATEAVVNLTCRWKGLSGNDIDLRLNYLGEIGGENTPSGLIVVFEKMAGGVLNPSISQALANLGDEEFDFIIVPYNDSATLDSLKDLMNDSTGRWSYLKQIYGHVFIAKKSTLAEAQAFGVTRNDQHCSILPFDNTPTPTWEVVAGLVGQVAKSIVIDPARPLQTLPILGMKAPDVDKRWGIQERNTLLHNGMSTFAVQSGTCQIERMITTYQKDAYGQPDDSYLDVEILYTSSYMLRFLRQRISTKYGRHKLASDDARFGVGQSIVTPKIIRMELIAAYGELELKGLVENSKLFAKNLIVERDEQNVNRVNILFAPDYVNQLRIFALINQFRLQY